MHWNEDSLGSSSTSYLSDYQQSSQTYATTSGRQLASNVVANGIDQEQPAQTFAVFAASSSSSLVAIASNASSSIPQPKTSLV